MRLDEYRERMARLAPRGEAVEFYEVLDRCRTAIESGDQDLAVSAIDALELTFAKAMNAASPAGEKPVQWGTPEPTRVKR